MKWYDLTVTLVFPGVNATAAVLHLRQPIEGGNKRVLVDSDKMSEAFKLGGFSFPAVK